MTIWLTFALALIVMIGAAFLISRKHALGLAWTFLHGETAIGFWLKIGMRLRTAIGIAILCSSLDILGWFLLANGAEATLRNGARQKTETKLEQSRMYAWARQLPYGTLPLCGLIPGNVWTGIAIAKVFGLNQYVSYALITLGNAGKMATAGYGINLGFSFFRRRRRSRAAACE